MKKSKKQIQQEKLAALLGLDAPTTQSQSEAHDKEMEAEAALEYYENPRSFTEKICKTCDRSFATRGAPVAYCSNPCRVKAFEERMGVKWQPQRKPEDRWGFLGEPLTVPHEALVIVQAAMVKQIELNSLPGNSDPIQDKPDEFMSENPLSGPLDSPQASVETDSLDVLDLLASMGLE